MPNRIVTDKCITTCTFQEFRPSIFALKIEGNLKRNELRILHYLIAFTYGRAEQSNRIFSYMAEQTMWDINRNTKTIDLESRAIKSLYHMAEGTKLKKTINININESRAIKSLSHMVELLLLECFYHAKQ